MLPGGATTPRLAQLRLLPEAIPIATPPGRAPAPGDWSKDRHLRELEDVIAPERIGQVLDELADGGGDNSSDSGRRPICRRTCGSHALSIATSVPIYTARRPPLENSAGWSC